MTPDHPAIFLDYARAAGAVTTRAAGVEAAADAIRAATPERLRVSAAAFRRFPDLAAALRDLAPVEVDDTPVDVVDRRALAEEIAGGTAVLLARAGVAETGSVLLADNSLAIRLLGMLSETCVVLLSTGDILPDLNAAGALIAQLEREGQRYCSLVTGPSRTADIERVLTIGVHGPRVLHVVVLDSPPG